MRINSSDIAKRYVGFQTEKLASLNKTKSDLLDSKEYILQGLKEYEDFLNNSCTIPFSNLERLNLSYYQRSILKPNLAAITQLKEVENKVKRGINILIELKKRITKVDEEIEQAKLLKVSEAEVSAVLGSFNLKITDEILSGYVFDLGYGVSCIKIKKKDNSNRKKKKIDWGESNKKKKEIIERGGVPYEALERNEKGEIVRDNGGEYWLEYHTKLIEYLWHWYKGRSPVPNKFLYKFKPSYCGAGQNGAVQKLKQLENSNSDKLKYFN